MGEIQLFHNRLTHSLKVSQIGRRLAERLGRSAPINELEAAGGLDPNVVEAACLGHDLGHPPFGHVGEEELRRMADLYNGDSFEGNAQSFRIVTKLAVSDLSKQRRGLNLTRATLAGLLKYPREYSAIKGDPANKKWGAYWSERADLRFALDGAVAQPTLEAQIMDWADDITYAIHDLEDFFRAGLIPLDRLRSREERRRFRKFLLLDMRAGDVNMFDTFFNNFGRVYFPTRYTGSIADREIMHRVSSELITRWLDDVTVRASGQLVVNAQSRREVAFIKQLTAFYVINDSSLATLQIGHKHIIQSLFDGLYGWAKDAAKDPVKWARIPIALREHIEWLGEDADAVAAARKDSDMLRARAVADYIASLTEPQALNLHQRLTGATAGSITEHWLRSQS